jgi:DNA-binding winged helix-turn-helix (wHTH) protein
MASEVLPAIQLDLGDERLRRGGRAIPLRPKTFALLRAFVAQPGRLLTKTALLDAVWGDTVVSDVVLMVCIRELRQALGDNASTPLFIETARSRGVWVATASLATSPPSPPAPSSGSDRPGTSPAWRSPTWGRPSSRRWRGCATATSGSETLPRQASTPRRP